MSVILVTGGAGYVGSHFVRTYLNRNSKDKVVVIDNLSKGHKEALPISERLSLLVGDIGDPELVEKALLSEKVDAVIHFAGKIEVGESEQDPFSCYDSNVVKSIVLFEAMERCAVRNIVFSSSCAVYGDPQYLPLDEKHQRAPKNIYGTSKQIVEQILSSLSQSSHWSSVILRYFNAAGANKDGELGESHDPETHLIPNLLKAALGRADFATINGTDYETRDGTCVRDYIHVEDLATAHCLALDYLGLLKKPTSLAINLGTSKGYTVAEVLTACEAITGLKVPSKKAPRRPGDAPALVANSTLARELLGWQPAYDLTGIIETAWRWEKNKRF